MCCFILLTQRSNEKELKFAWERYGSVDARCSKMEGQKQAKIESKVSEIIFNIDLSFFFSMHNIFS